MRAEGDADVASRPYPAPDYLQLTQTRSVSKAGGLICPAKDEESSAAECKQAAMGRRGRGRAMKDNLKTTAGARAEAEAWQRACS